MSSLATTIIDIFFTQVLVWLSFFERKNRKNFRRFPVDIDTAKVVIFAAIRRSKLPYVLTLLKPWSCTPMWLTCGVIDLRLGRGPDFMVCSESGNR